MEQSSFVRPDQAAKTATTSSDLLPLIRNLSSSSSLSTSSSGQDRDRRKERQQKWTHLVLAWLWRKQETSTQSKQEAQEDKNRKRRYLAIAAIIITLVAIWWHRNKRKRGMLFMLLSMLGDSDPDKSSYRRAKETPLSILYKAAKEGNVKQALLMSSQTAIAYQDQEGTWRRTTLPPKSPNVQTNLLETLAEGGCTNVSALPESIWSKLATPTIAALPFVYLALLYKMMRNLHSGANDAARTYNEEASQQVTFDDIAGLDKVVTEVSEVVSYLENPSFYQQLGARPPRGILLFGPPGSGKTLLARAVAGQARCEAFMACSGSDFVESYVGRGAARIRNLFDQARAQARKSEKYWYSSLFGTKTETKSRPASAVIFMDEIDALARSRCGFGGGGGGNEERDQTLNQLLTELDGFASNGDDVTVIFIGATNRPDVLDPAILRRFDRRIHVGYPDARGRRAILEIHARRIQHGLLDYDYLASEEMTRGFSGADLRNVVNDAALLAVREQCPLVEQRHVLHAIRRVQQMKQSLDRTGVDSLLSNLPLELR